MPTCRLVKISALGQAQPLYWPLALFRNALAPDSCPSITTGCTGWWRIRRCCSTGRPAGGPGLGSRSVPSFVRATLRLVRARGEEQKDGPDDEHENRHGRADRDADHARNDGERARGTEHGAIGEDARRRGVIVEDANQTTERELHRYRCIRGERARSCRGFGDDACEGRAIGERFAARSTLARRALGCRAVVSAAGTAALWRGIRRGAQHRRSSTGLADRPSVRERSARPEPRAFGFPSHVSPSGLDQSGRPHV